MRSITKPQPPIPTLIVNDELLMDNKAKCNHFANAFLKAFDNVANTCKPVSSKPN
uniref:Uncharacterized protein n=1 Tax=Meloidogyne hapla TaxID=6305 RepID=A0A1I8BGJ1_MELHA